jgi:hypothetical protein
MKLRERLRSRRSRRILAALAGLVLAVAFAAWFRGFAAVGLLLLGVSACVVVGFATWRWPDRFGKVLGHPFATAAATAVFSGLVATGVIRLWQNHDKSLDIQRIHAEQELELKSGLVRDIGATSARFLGTAASGADRGSLGRAYITFQVDSARVGSELAAYFSVRTVNLWNGYSYILGNLYYLLASPPGNARNLYVFRLSGYLPTETTNIDGLCFTAETRPTDYQKGLRFLISRLQTKEKEIVGYVVGSGSALTRESAAPLPIRPPRPAGGITRQPCGRYFSRR